MPKEIKRLEKQIIKEFIVKDILVTEQLKRELAQNIEKIYSNHKNDSNLIENLISQYKKNNTLNNYKIINSKTKLKTKITVTDFTKYYNQKLSTLTQEYLKQFQNLNYISINKINKCTKNETITTIGIISKISKTKNNNYFISLEDNTGIINTIVTNTKKKLFLEASNLIEDEVIAITGNASKDVVFVNEILKLNKHTKTEKTLTQNQYMIVLGDLHIGSKEFQEDKFDKFLEWINKNSAKINYITIIGDIVDGVGVYPGQKEDLIIKDIKKQYKKFEELITKIPKEIIIFITPGNHDSSHLAEPQVAISHNYLDDISKLPNVNLLTNPSKIIIYENNQELNISLYHGYSYDFFIDKVEHLRKKDPYNNPKEILKYIFEKNNFAPTFGSTPIIPVNCDDHTINNNNYSPDIIISGHLHNADFLTVDNTLLVSAGTWQERTDFQKKRNITPSVCKVPIINLKNQKTKILDFSK